MKNDLREMLKNVVEENAVGFKNSTAKALYSKIANRLDEEYKNVAKTLMRPKNETNNRTNRRRKVYQGKHRKR